MNILIVDDEVSFRMLLKNYLVDEGFEVFLADNGAEGLSKLREEKVDLVISDLHMHIMDGITFCKTARSIPQFARTPFLFVSAYEDAQIVERIQSLRHSAFLSKGRPTNELIELIHKLATPKSSPGDDPPADLVQVPSDDAHRRNEAPGGDPIRKRVIPEHPRILVVDDDDALRMLLNDMLSKEGFIVVTAADGQEAIDLLRKETFDLVLLDIIMPNVSGYGVLTFMGENVRSTRVIMLTAYADLSLAVECKTLGADDFIGKPFMRPDLLNTIRQVLSK